jgi:glycosyltransferase involved in cell wall biosynthesis
MRIAFLCKQRYMGKDVIDDRYARLYEIPHQLARLGHDVVMQCIGYQGQASGDWEHEALPGRLRLRASGIAPPWLPALLSYPARVLDSLRAFQPDVVIGASDIPNVALAAWVARRLGRPYVADLYDNFEAYGQARVPGMVALLRRATRQASLVTTTSEALATYVRDSYGTTGEVLAVPSAIDSTVFRPQERSSSRAELGLPAHALLVGTAGALHPMKGIGELYAAWDSLKADPRIHLVLAGVADDRLSMPTGERVHFLGPLPHERVATLFSALDVATICVPDTPFGRYCFPQKAYEILATGTPLVASDLGAMHDVLADYPALRYRPGDASSLADCVRKQLHAPVKVDVAVPNWTEAVRGIESHIRTIADVRR